MATQPSGLIRLWLIWQLPYDKGVFASKRRNQARVAFTPLNTNVSIVSLPKRFSELEGVAPQPPSVCRFRS